VFDVCERNVVLRGNGETRKIIFKVEVPRKFLVTETGTVICMRLRNYSNPKASDFKGTKCGITANSQFIAVGHRKKFIRFFTGISITLVSLVNGVRITVQME